MLVLRIVRWILGYVQFEIIGTDSQRFLTGASVRGFNLWDMEKIAEDRCVACIHVRDYKELRTIAKKRRLRLRVCKRCGLPFFVERCRKNGKHGLFLGTICGIVLLCVLSTKVWVINVSGNVSLSTEEIKAAAAEFGLEIGTGKQDYNPVSVEDQLMLRYPQISWISVNNWGNTVDIVIKEGEAIPEVEDSSAVGNVTAKRAGQIIRMDVYHGKSMVKIGDGVAPGELLVSGILEYENGGVGFTKASAKIMARTRRQFRVEIPMEETIREDTGKVVVRKSAKVFGVTIPLTFQGVPSGLYQRETSGESVQVNGVDLPLTIYQETYVEQSERVVPVSEEEARRRGEEEIRKQQEEALEDSMEPGTVLSENLTFFTEDGKYILESDCLCLENIAQEQPFFVEMEEESTESIEESEK